MNVSNLPWATLYEDADIAVVQSLLDKKPEGWVAIIEEMVAREIQVHEMCDNWIKADVLREWFASL